MSHSDHKWIDRVKTFVRNLRDAQHNARELNTSYQLIEKLWDRVRDEQYRGDFLERDNEELLRLHGAKAIPLAASYEALESRDFTLQTIDIDLRPIRGSFYRHVIVDMGGCRAVAEKMAKDTAELWRRDIYTLLCDRWNVPKERR